MKDFYIAALFFCLQHTLCAQEKKHSLSLYGTYANGADFVSTKTLSDAGTTYNQAAFFQTGLEYGKDIGQRTSLHCALQFSSHTFHIITTTVSPGLGAILSEQRKLAFISLPVTLRFNFWTYCFLRSGLMLDAQTENKSVNRTSEGKGYLNQSGIGGVFGVGLQYPFKRSFTVYTSADAAFHGLILFSQTGPKQRLVEDGLQLGLRYRF